MKASETVRPVWSAVRVVQVHIGSNCKEVCFGHALVACWQSILTGGGAGRSALPKEAPGTRGKCIISCAYAVRGCSDPVAGACCRSHLQNYHGITLFRAYKSPEGRGEGKGGMGQPVQGPWHGNKGMLGGTPTPAGS